jgi:hypothetical protein
MAKVPIGVPLSPWQKKAEALGKQIASQRKPPDPNVSKKEIVARTAQLLLEEQRGVPANTYFDTAKQDLTKHMDAIHDHAKMAHGGPGPYPVKGFVHSRNEPPRDVTIERTTPGQIKKEIGYGDQWGNMMDALVDAEKNFPADNENSISRKSLGGVLKASEQPIHVVVANGGPDAHMDSVGFAHPYANWMYMNQQNPRFQDYGPEAVKFHEATHLMTHPFPERPTNQMFGGKVPWEANLAKAKQYFSDPDQAREYAFDLEHGGRWEELEAHFAELKALNYGLTGKLTRTPEENVRFLQQILTNKPAFGTKGEMFQPDPIMQHGPRAGQPARLWHKLQQIHRDTFPRGTSQEKKIIVPNFFKSALNDRKQGEADAMV